MEQHRANRKIEIALPVELSREEQTRLVREYCSSQFISKGMCADFNIHDTGSGTPTPISSWWKRCMGSEVKKGICPWRKRRKKSDFQAANIKHEKLTLWTGTGRRTPTYGARHGLIWQMIFWRETAAQSGREQTGTSGEDSGTDKLSARNRSARFPATSTLERMYPLTTSGGWLTWWLPL